jgi:hypothetical protein
MCRRGWDGTINVKKKSAQPLSKVEEANDLAEILFLFLDFVAIPTLIWGEVMQFHN